MKNACTCLTTLSLVLMMSASAAGQAAVYDQRGLTGHEFGYSVATVGDVDGDGLDDYAVGSPHEDGGQPDSGVVNVFSAADNTVIRRFDGWWTGDQFGFSVAGLGDIDNDNVGELIVGAPTHGPGGGIFVYSIATGAELYHIADFLSSNVDLGWAVAGPGDVNWDGIPDFAYSVPGDVNGYVVVNSGFNGQILAVWNGENLGDRFGHSLAGAGDVNTDGANELVVGAPKYDASAANPDSGKVYVHTGSSVNPLFTFTRGIKEEELGHAVAGGEDLSGDLVPDIVIGTPLADTFFGNETGRVDVVASTGVFMYSIPGQVAGDHFGYSVDLVPDLDGNARGDIVVGAPDKDSFGIVDSGMAYVISSTTAGTLFSQNGYQFGDRMGGAVSSGGLLNADAWGDVLFGAPTADHATLGVDSGWVRSHLGNAAPPSTYCTAKVNSQGCTPMIGYAGCTSQSVSDYFGVVANNVLPNKAGIMIWSYQPKASPFYGGTLCVKSPKRTPLQVSAQTGPGPCDGQYVFVFDHAYMALKNVPVGSTVHFQYWSRDPGLAPPNAIGLTDAMAALILP